MKRYCLVAVLAGVFCAFSTAQPADNDHPLQDLRRKVIREYDSAVPTLLNAQTLESDAEKDPNGILVGQFRGTFNCRQQEGVYILAYLYQEKQSEYYHDAELLERVLLNVDYMCRAQGSNGGYNEYPNQGGWCGVALPDGGNSTRRPGKSSVAGFTFYCLARSLVLLADEPAFRERLDVRIDNDGDGTKNVTRRQAYKYLLNDKINGGKMPGAMTYLHHNGRGHAPNQDTGALAAAHAVNEAYKFLSGGEKLRTREELKDLRDHVLHGKGWFSDKGMLLEGGHGGRGYDANYGVVTLHTLGAYAEYADDPVAAEFIGKFMEGYQYFFVLDEEWPKGAYHEWRLARRSGGPRGIPVFAAGLTREHHPALRTLYAAGLEELRENPGAFVPGGSHLFQIDAAQGIDCLLNWGAPESEGYVLPCNSDETFTYRDKEANLEVTKTGRAPTTVTWKAYEWDGGVKEYTYQPPEGSGGK